jgi:hypothetical protein
VGPADSVLVAFAGHGVQFRGEDEVYFCPAGAKLADKTTLVSLSDIYRELEKCPAGFKGLLSDACRNDPLVAEARSAGRVELGSVTRPRTAVPPGGLVSLFSCSPGEQAFESGELQHGVFFHYVIRGLRADADLDHDGQVTLPELEQYVKKEVYRFVRAEYGKEQTPDLVGKTRGLVPLVEGLTPASPAVARRGPPDEGFWLFENPPRDQVRGKYGFELTDAWVDHLRQATVRFNTGGTGAFVSADGLVVTNHHVASGVLAAISTPQQDRLKDGFYAATAAEEVKCPGLEMAVVVGAEDVTRRVNAAADRAAAVAAVEKESLDLTGLRSEVVTLYQGGEYHLYRY